MLSVAQLEHQSGVCQHGGDIRQTCGDAGLRETLLPESALRKSERFSPTHNFLLKDKSFKFRETIMGTVDLLCENIPNVSCVMVFEMLVCRCIC